MRRRRHLTPLELDWARQAVHQLCLANHLKPGDETYLSAGLQAFWEVYTARPSVSGQDFWPCAFRKMEEAILAEKRENDRWTYARSLDAPVAPDREVTYFDLLRARQGDFTNTVLPCLITWTACRRSNPGWPAVCWRRTRWRKPAAPWAGIPRSSAVCWSSCRSN